MREHETEEEEEEEGILEEGKDANFKGKWEEDGYEELRWVLLLLQEAGLVIEAAMAM